VTDFRISGYDAVEAWVQRRLADPFVQGSSALDEIRPIAWDFELQSELLQVIAIVEEIATELTPRAAKLLAAIEAGATLQAAELDRPDSSERRAPAGRVTRQQQLL